MKAENRCMGGEEETRVGSMELSSDLASSDLARPKYLSVSKVTSGVRDKKGAIVTCEACGDEQAVWTGIRRPTARIMARRFDMCGGCWKTKRMD